MNSSDPSTLASPALPHEGALVRRDPRELAPRPTPAAPVAGTSAGEEEDFIDLRQLWGILMRRGVRCCWLRPWSC